MSNTELDVYHRMISRTDAYGRQATKQDKAGHYGYFCQKKELTDKDLLRSLSSENLTIGTYCIEPETQTTKNPTVDVDAHTEEERKEAEDLTKRVYSALNTEAELYPYIEASSGRIEDGAHIGVICPAVSAGDAIVMFERVLKREGVEVDEIFPKQATVEKGKYGNLVKLPWQYNNRTGKRSEIIDPVTWEPMERQEAIQFMMDLPDSVIPEVEKEPAHINILGKCGLCFQTTYQTRAVLEHEQGHYFRLYACRELIFHGATDVDIHQYFKVQNDYDPDITQDKINDMRQTDYKPVSCEKIIKTGFVDETQCQRCIRKQRSETESEGIHTESAAKTEKKLCETCHFFKDGTGKDNKYYMRCDKKVNGVKIGFDPEPCKHWKEGKNKGKGEAKKETYTSEITDMANQLLDEGDPFNFILETWNEKHIGDKIIGQTALLSLAGANISNTKGIHPKPSGNSGTGKSDALTSMLFLVPPDKYITGSLSGKSLFYDDDLKPGCIICNDDQKLNDDLIDTIKQSTSKYQEVTYHRTVKNQEKGEYSIPERVTFWLAGVDGLDDEQMGNRFINVDVDESEEQDERVYNKQVEEEYTASNVDDITDQVLVCRAIFKLIGENTYNVKIPFTDSIEWFNKDNRRNFPMFKDMIRSIAVFKQRQRLTQDDLIIATVEDFKDAKKIYQQIGEKNATNLTENELKVMRYLEAIGEAEVKDIAKYMGVNVSTARSYLHGKDKNVDGGLLAKVPGLHMDQVSVSIREGESQTTTTRKNIYICETKKFNLNSFGDVVGIDEEKAVVEYSTAVDTVTTNAPQTPHKRPTISFKKMKKPLLRDIIINNIDNNKIMTHTTFPSLPSSADYSDNTEKATRKTTKSTKHAPDGETGGRLWGVSGASVPTDNEPHILDQRKRIAMVRDTIIQLQKTNGDYASYDEVNDIVMKLGVDDVDILIKELKRTGVISEKPDNMFRVV